MSIGKDSRWRDPGEAPHLIDSPAFQYGFGLFETIRISNSLPLDLEDHLQRLLTSITALDPAVPCPFPAETLTATAIEAAGRYNEPDGVLKIIAYRTATSWDIQLLTRPYPYNPGHYERGFSLTRSPSVKSSRGLLVYHKTLNYLENYLERRRALANGFDDAYFLNTEDIVTECTAANLFVGINGDYFTSPIAAGLLPGIMRAKALRGAAQLGLSITETPVTTQMLNRADSAFATNALVGAMPICRIDDVTYAIDHGFMAQLCNALGRPID